MTDLVKLAGLWLAGLVLVALLWAAHMKRRIHQSLKRSGELYERNSGLPYDVDGPLGPLDTGHGWDDGS